MRTALVCIFILGALSLRAEGGTRRHDLLSGMYAYGDPVSGTAPGTVAMDPFRVSAERADSLLMSSMQRSLDFLFNVQPLIDKEREGIDLSSLQFIRGIESLFAGHVEPSRDAAILERGGVRISDHAVFYARGSILHPLRTVRKYELSIGLRLNNPLGPTINIAY